jgi:hypothetical protein
MLLKPKVEMLPSMRREPVAFDPFHEDRVREDLAEFSEAPGVFEQCVRRASVRFRNAGERAILRQWTNLYQTGERLIAAKVAMERLKSEYLQLAREHEIKETGKATELAKLRADGEEHDLRRDKAAHQRQSVACDLGERAEGTFTEDEQNLRQACERRQLDARWELNESLRPLQSLIELQRWRRQQRDQILKVSDVNYFSRSTTITFPYQRQLQALRTDLSHLHWA